MLKYHSDLTTLLLKNEFIKKYYDKGYSLVGVKFNIYNFEKQALPKLACLNINNTNTNADDFCIKKIDDLYLYYSYRESPSSLVNEKKYLNLIKGKYNAVTLFMLLLIFILVALSSYVSSSLSGYFGIAIAILITFSVIQSVSLRRFTNKIYRPFLENNGFLENELTSKYLLQVIEQISIQEIYSDSIKANISKLEVNEQYYHYMIETKNSKNEIEGYLRKVLKEDFTLSLILKDY